MPSASRLLVVGGCMVLAQHGALGLVDCGGHYAETCAVCPEDNAEIWCHGDCMWVSGSCVTPGWWQHFQAWTWWTWYAWLHSLPYIFGIGLVMAIYAAVYNKKIVEEIPQEGISPQDPDFDDWQDREVGLFDCFKYPDQLLWSIFCTPVVAGKNYQVGGKVMGFWPACCMVFVGIFSLFWPLYCLMALVRTALSSKLKKNMGFKSNFGADFCVTLFCFPCEIARESIEVNDAIGVTLKCPFEVQRSLVANVEMLAESADRTCRMCS